MMAVNGPYKQLSKISKVNSYGCYAVYLSSRGRTLDQSKQVYDISERNFANVNSFIDAATIFVRRY